MQGLKPVTSFNYLLKAGSLRARVRTSHEVSSYLRGFNTLQHRQEEESEEEWRDKRPARNDKHEKKPSPIASNTRHNSFGLRFNAYREPKVIPKPPRNPEHNTHRLQPRWFIMLTKYYLDRTGLQERPKLLEDLITGKYSGSRIRFIQGLLIEAGVDIELFLDCRDILSVNSLDAAVGRLKAVLKDKKREIGESEFRCDIPLACWLKILQKPSSATGILSLVPFLTTPQPALSPDERAFLLVKLTSFLVYHRLLTVIPYVVHAYLDIKDPDKLDGLYSSKGMISTLGMLSVKATGASHKTERKTQASELCHQLVMEVVSEHMSRGGSLKGAFAEALARPALLGPELRAFIEKRRLEQEEEEFGTPANIGLLRACFISATWDGSIDEASDLLVLLKDGLASPDVVTYLKKIGRFGAAEQSLGIKQSKVSDISQIDYEDLERDTLELRSSEAEVADKKDVALVWNELLMKLANSPAINTGRWLDIIHSLPKQVQESIFSVKLRGAFKRGLYEEMLVLWEEHCNDEDFSPDNLDLMDMFHAIDRLKGLNPAIAFVDSWATKAFMDPSEAQARTVQLDTRLINTLIGQCGRKGQADLALRLWEVMEARWGVRQDGDTLAHVIHCARVGEKHKRHLDNIFKTEEGTFRPFGGIYEAIKRAFMRDPHSVVDVREGRALVNNPWSASQSIESVLNVSDSSGAAKLTSREARSIFQDILFSNWPKLREVQSPINMADQQDSGFAFIARPVSLASNGRSGAFSDLATSADYAHISPSLSTFQAYLLLLHYLSLANEIPLVFAWMKELDIRPAQKNLLQAFRAVSQAEGPARMVSIELDSEEETGEGTGKKARGKRRVIQKWLRDEEILRLWLIDWLGEEAVPTEERVATYRAMSQNHAIGGGA